MSDVRTVATRAGVLSSRAALTLLLSACATTTQKQVDTEFRAPSGPYRVVVMQPDVSVGQLTAGGMVEPREEWTNQARANVLRALEAEQTAHGAVVKIAATAADAGWDPAATEDLIALHRAVGAAIQAHKYGFLTLPTKKDHFDWTLGEQAVAFGAATHYDYALFVHASDSFSSGGRIALQAVGALGCALVGACVVVPGGQQSAFASLVDLKTGKVVWFNVLVSGVGDIRTPEGATAMVGKLLETINTASPVQSPKRT
jgi:hypothetical protein